MSNVLLLQEGTGAEAIVTQTLAAQGHCFTCLDIEEFHPEMLIIQIFELIIIDLSRQSSSCILVLQQLEKWSAISGLEHPPVIVVSKENTASIEQIIRTTKVVFYLVQPVTEAELFSAIEQSLQRTKSLKIELFPGAEGVDKKTPPLI